MSIVAWFKGLMRRRPDDEDIQEEIRAHLAIATDERVAGGADRTTANKASLKDFGNVTLVTEVARGVWMPHWLTAVHDLLSDVRYAIRTLAKHPAFSLTVVGVLTLGIGLNAVVFTMLKGFDLSPLAGVEGSSRLRVIYGETSAGRAVRLSYPDYQDLRDHNPTFSGLFGSGLITASLGRGRSSRQIWSELVTGNYFQVLGVRAELGRTLLPTDELAPGQHPVAVLSDGLWRRDFNADPDIVGKTVEINNNLLTVVGVADSTFHGTIVGYDVEAFVPVMMTAKLGVDVSSRAKNVLADRTARVLMPQGFLRPGASVAAAAAATDAIWAAHAADRSLTDVVERLRVVPFWQSPTGGQTFILPAVMLMTMMGWLVLMIACANIAGLVLVRGWSRRGDIAMRLALGATRARIVRMLIVENLVLAAPGALLGVLIAERGVPLFIETASGLAAPMRLFFNIQTDRFVIVFSVLAACGSALLFGFLPALRSARIDLVAVIKEDASSRGAARGRLRSWLVVAQVAVSLLLLVAAGLVTRSFESARQAYPGFDGRHVTAIQLDVRENGYDEPRGRAFYQRLLDDVRADPGVESASLAAINPMNLLGTRPQYVTIDGYAPRRGEDLAFESNAVSAEYFRTLSIPMLFGREFADQDDDSSRPVAIVNRTLAERFWGEASRAIGHRVRIGDDEWRTVVGVAADVKYARINEAPAPYVYLPYLQAYRSVMILHARGQASVDTLVDRTRAHVSSLDADLPILAARSLEEQTQGALGVFRLVAFMLFLFGAAGMALAALGTYGLVSYTVTQSTHEIGIRMALGAGSLSVVRGFLARGLRLGVTGAALGAVAALGVGTVLGSVLFGVSATDGLSFARALAIVLGGVTVATIVPAWRAARTDPLRALRHH